MALPATDTWNQTTGSDQGIATYGPYSVLEGGIEIPSGVQQYEPTGGTYNTARRNNETFDADQYSQIAVTASQISGSIYCGPAVRCQSGSNSSYHVETNGGAVYLSKCASGSQSTLAGPIASLTYSAGDVLRLTAQGAGATVTVKVWKAPAADPTNFTEAYSYDDTSGSRITTAGQAGVFAYGSSDDFGGGAWEGGNIGGGGGGGGGLIATRKALLGVGA